MIASAQNLLKRGIRAVVFSFKRVCTRFTQLAHPLLMCRINIDLSDGGDRSLDGDRCSGSGGNGSGDGGGAIEGSGEVSAINQGQI